MRAPFKQVFPIKAYDICDPVAVCVMTIESLLIFKLERLIVLMDYNAVL
ncbi:hypothetical protein [Neomoorella glycerini]|nr:hypothetical protein [Moorella glycerini]